MLKILFHVSFQTLDEEPALDAEFINVYKGTHGVIMMLDITKQWLVFIFKVPIGVISVQVNRKYIYFSDFPRTFDYVQRELPKVPPEIPVLVLSNHRDMGHHRCVTEEQVNYFIESLDRQVSPSTYNLLVCFFLLRARITTRTPINLTSILLRYSSKPEKVKTGFHNYF